MSKKSGSQPPKPLQRKAATVRKSSATTRRRTRMIALEPRMLFDGALGVDLAAQATAVARGDAQPAAPADVHAPAAIEAPQQATADAAIKTADAERAIVEAPAGAPK